jgi:hypothetical protein
VSDDYGDDDARLSRRRSLWGFAVLVMVAIIVVTFVVLFTGSNEGGSNDLTTGSDDSTQSGAMPGSSSPSSPSPSSRSRSRSTPPAVAGGPAVAGLARRINALRTEAGLPRVVAQPSDDADSCAASEGSGPTCVPHYMYAQVPDRDPATTMQALESVNRSWLLDASTLRIEIGFAKLPEGGYDCALLKFP